MKLEPPDSHHLEAAKGWLGLGNWNEANEELEKLAAPLRVHPDVLQVRYLIYANAKKWDHAWEIGKALVSLVPQQVGSWTNAAYASRRAATGGLQTAYDTLLPGLEHHPDEPIIPFNLACYSCQQGNLTEAKRWLEQAIAAGNSERIKVMALNDPDLEPLWKEIGTL